MLGKDIANELVVWFNAVDLTYRLRVELRTGLADLRTELVRWMFAFWVSTLIGIAGLLIALRR